MHIGTAVRAAIIIAGMTSTAALASNCGREPCSTRISVKGSSVIPPPDEFQARGDVFSSQFTDVALRPDSSRQVNLGFDVNFGFATGPTNMLFLNENGIVSFGAPIGSISGAPISAQARALATGGGGFQPVTSLKDFGVPVIAPFYANLTEGSGAGDGQLENGDIVVQYGMADPYANDDGTYSRTDLRPAVRITWYGVGVDGGSSAKDDAQVFAQLLISSDQNGLDSFEFRYGPLSDPGQDGDGSIAGFSLGSNFQQFSGPYRGVIPAFFEFQDGKYIGQSVAGVPEPAIWLELVLGFGALGAALRIARRRRAPGAPMPLAG